MFLAASELVEHLTDHPWPGCQVRVLGVPVTWMSSAIGSILIVGVVLAVIIPLIARGRSALPTGSRNLLEVIVVFVRDMIAKPALRGKAYAYLPFLLTMFVFILGMNLIGVLPLQPLSKWAGGHVGWLKGRAVGVTPTSVPTVCMSLASISLLAIVTSGMRRSAVRCHERRGWPLWLCAILSPLLWVRNLSPRVPGITGKILMVPLALLELSGAVVKCFALLVRLFANMLAGHALLAVVLMLMLQAAAVALQRNIALLGASVACILGGAAVYILELMTAALQAYIFTFLTAMFLGLYSEPEH